MVVRMSQRCRAEIKFVKWSTPVLTGWLLLLASAFIVCSRIRSIGCLKKDLLVCCMPRCPAFIALSNSGYVYPILSKLSWYLTSQRE